MLTLILHIASFILAISILTLDDVSFRNDGVIVKMKFDIKNVKQGDC